MVDLITETIFQCSQENLCFNHFSVFTAESCTLIVYVKFRYCTIQFRSTSMKFESISTESRFCAKSQNQFGRFFSNIVTRFFEPGPRLIFRPLIGDIVGGVSGRRILLHSMNRELQPRYFFFFFLFFYFFSFLYAESHDFARTTLDFVGKRNDVVV